MDRGTEEESYYREQHLDNNTFEVGDTSGRGSWNQGERQDGDGGRGKYIEGEEVRVVVVTIRDGRVSDWKGAVRDWRLEGQVEDNVRQASLVNGVPSRS